MEGKKPGIVTSLATLGSADVALQEKGVAIAYLVSSSILCLSLFIFNLRAKM